jgi:hypothetical protein
MKNVTFDTVVALYDRRLIPKTELLRVVKTLKLTDEQALKLFDIEVWGKDEMATHFQLRGF